MIISRTPVRIPLGGGGTDLVSYSSKYGGFIISAAINKYIYVGVNERFVDTIRLSYSKTEIVNDVPEIQHNSVREALKLMGISKGIEIVTIADVLAGTGMGTSGSFLVGLLNALHAYKKEHIPRLALAEEACKIEIDILKEPIGKHDQYLAAFGGLTCLDIDTKGTVTVIPLKISVHTSAELEHNLLLFYTGISRKSSTVLREQYESSDRNEKKVIDALHHIKEIGQKIKESLEQDSPDVFGRLLDEHWQTKKRLSNKVVNSKINRWYEIAKENGALGGKIIGAGGGGFFVFYCKDNKQRLREVMDKEGLREIRFRFDYDGSKILFNL